MKKFRYNDLFVSSRQLNKHFRILFIINEILNNEAHAYVKAVPIEY